MCFTRFVMYDDLNDATIAVFLVYGGEIEEILDHKQQRSYCSDLVRIFYANMGKRKDVILTVVKGEFMTITLAMISKIFRVQNFGRKE